MLTVCYRNTFHTLNFKERRIHSEGLVAVCTLKLEMNAVLSSYIDDVHRRRTFVVVVMGTKSIIRAPTLSP
eukprot:m.156801 g.156801  ORF g.156801 m.156801 type:complete len:71 (+) comp31026_c0_seq1:120-332(+)